MSLPINKFAAFVAGLMIAGVAQAQLLPTWETNITLTQQDLDMIHAAVTNQFATNASEPSIERSTRSSSWPRRTTRPLAEITL